jgi:methionyl-tRNA formyltransferase
MGTPALAAHILEWLAAADDPRFTVVAAVTRPDQPRGRGLALLPSELARVAARFSIPVLKPLRIRTPEFLAELRSFNPDLLVVAAYGRILPGAVLDVPRLMAINVHASLLPRHRGAAPIEGAILAGDAETGVTIIRMTARMDAGPILLQREIALAPDETQATLKEKLSGLGAQALLETLDLLSRGQVSETPQDESAATLTAPVKKDDAVIDWALDAVRIERMTRAYDPWPTARTTLGGEPLLIWRARVAAAEAPAGGAEPGTVVALEPRPAVLCGTGVLELVEVQAAGRKRMAAEEFARGRHLALGQRLGT